MSAWRRVTLERLPEFRRLIEQAASPMALRIDLLSEFEALHLEPDLHHDLIGRVCDYARWCLESPATNDAASDPRTAVVCAFYEHLPLHPVIRRAMPLWLGLAQLRTLRDAFRYHLQADEFELFESEFANGCRAEPPRKRKAGCG